MMVYMSPQDRPQSKCLGRTAPKSDARTLMFAAFAPRRQALPPRTTFWAHKKAFVPESWGNDREGCCTISKQANMFRRFERLEQRRTVEIATAEVHRVYRSLIEEKYGAGPNDDTGAFEEDALDRSRRPETALRDAKGRPLVIDAYVRLNASDATQIRQGISAAAGHGIAICINLPMGFASLEPPAPWDVPDGTNFAGDWAPGSWGGHSMWAIEYDDSKGILLEHTWSLPPQWITWRAAAAYIDEAHVVIDSVDAWRKRLNKADFDIDGVVDAVNAVSSKKIGR